MIKYNNITLFWSIWYQKLKQLYVCDIQYVHDLYIYLIDKDAYLKKN